MSATVAATDTTRAPALFPDISKYVDEYWARGWTVVPNVFSVAESDELSLLLMEITKQEQRDMLEKNGTLANDFMTDVGEDGSAAPRKTSNPFQKRRRFRQLAAPDGRLEAVASAMLKSSARIFSDQAFMKGPRVGGAKPSHQDNFYFGIDSSDDVVTCWTALDDTDLENGCMRLIDGSFLSGIVPHKKTYKDASSTHFDWDAEEGHYDPAKEVPVLVPKGATLCWHGASLHGSCANSSDRWRRAWAVHFVADGAAKEGSTASVDESCARYVPATLGAGRDVNESSLAPKL